YLKENVKEVDGLAIIAEKETGELIGNSLGLNNFVLLSDETIERTSIEDIDKSIINQAYDIYRETPSTQFKVENEGENFYFHIREFQREGIDWLVISAIPEGLLMADIYAIMRLTTIIAIAAAFISIIIY